MLETMVTKKVSIVLPLFMDPKERILQKAHELFNRYGIRSVSMDEIAAQVGMSKKTIYQYYVDKDELVSAVFTGVMMHNKQACTADRASAENALHEVFLAFEMVQEMFAEMNPSVLYDMQKYHPATFAEFRNYRDGFLYQMIRTNMERGIAEGLYRPEMDVEVLTRYRLHSMMLAFDTEVFPNNRTQLVHIEQQLLEHFLYGLATAKGQQLIEKYWNQRTTKGKDK
jgi:AcrR family transcriptional regulator